MRFCFSTAVCCVICLAALAGCGTTKSSNTSRTATEQLLISDAMDRAVSQLDFRAVAGKKVYLDAKPVAGVTDSAYLVSTMRQHMLAAGCVLKDQRPEADYIVELRSGAVGTDHRELILGVPATQVPDIILPMAGIPGSLPEMPLAKKTEQRAVAKIAVFAYNQKTGRPVWQSGVSPVESEARDIWVLGAGPFQRGNIYEGTKFAGDNIPLVHLGRGRSGKLGEISVADQAYFAEPRLQIAKKDAKPKPEATPQKQPDAAAVAKSTPKPKDEEPARQPDATKVVPASHTAAAPAARKQSPPSAKKDAPPAPLPLPEGAALTSKDTPGQNANAAKAPAAAQPAGAKPKGEKQPAAAPSSAPAPEIRMLPPSPEKIREPLALPPKTWSPPSYLPPPDRPLLRLFD